MRQVRFCPRGHDTHATGRINGRCKACHGLTSHSRRRHAFWPRGGRSEPRLPWEPLRSVLERKDCLALFESNTKTRWSSNGVPLSVVDHLCCTLLLVHPFEVYGADWFQVEETA
jgi:hypothetical protein